MILLISPATTVTASESENREAEGIFSISRLVIAGSIEDREPVGMVNSFSSSTEQVYCFLEAADIKENTSVSFVWYHGEEEKAKVTLPLGKSSRWRTYSSKKLGGLKGNWKVVLQDSSGAVLQSIEFAVE
jgi:hypothetical protein